MPPLIRSASFSAADAHPAVVSASGTLTARALDDIDALSRDPAAAAQGIREERESRARRAQITAHRAATPGARVTPAQLGAGIARLRHVGQDDILRQSIAKRRMQSQGVSLAVSAGARAAQGAQAKAHAAALDDYLASNLIVPWRPEDLNQILGFFDNIMTTAELADVVSEVGKWEAAFDEVMNGVRDGYKQFSDAVDAQLSADKKARELKIQLALIVVNLALSAFGFGPVGSMITGAVGLAMDPDGLAKLGGVAKGTHDLILSTEAYRVTIAQNLAKGGFDALTKYGVDQLTTKIKTAADVNKKAAQYNKKLIDLNAFQSEMARTLQSFKETIYGEHKEIVRRYREPQRITALLWELCKTLSSPYNPLMDTELVTAARQARDYLRKRASERLGEAFACPVEVRRGTWQDISHTVEKTLWAMWADQSIEARDDARAKQEIGGEILERLVKIGVVQRRDFRAFAWNRGKLAADRQQEHDAFVAAEAGLSHGDLSLLDGLKVHTGKSSTGEHAARSLLRWAELYLQSQPFQRVIPVNRDVARRILAYQDQAPRL